MTQSLLDSCEQTTREKGLAAGLTSVLTDVDVAASAPATVVAVPRDWPVTTDGEVSHPLAEAESLAFVRLLRDQDAPGDWCSVVAARLARARIGLTDRVLGEAAAYLSARTAMGEPLVRKQLITGSIADLVAELPVVRHHADLLAQKPRPESAAHLHARIDRLDWQVTLLFGASGYLTDHPARGLYVSALVANSWIGGHGQQEGEQQWN
ncbi:acyl-CoA dehydrogenase family protein [Streptomyces sp. NBC_01092]|uniref:acyl-CoA dehydrogenase family protein n=1 Tax=Streptomyces sp. NBC_01092 TaxID=2903748 RepID=UPI0038665151|nr:acyl-CoA dehydrogenase family protein [Streptomyces sp. NBC_01092]